jgi:hypothetical protein
MKHFKKIAALFLLILATQGAFSQNRLELNQDVFYNDSIFTNNESVYIDISIFNNSAFAANGISIVALRDTIRLNLLQGDSNTNIAPFQSLDTNLLLQLPLLLDSGKTTTFQLIALTTSAGIAPDNQTFSIFYENLPQGEPLLAAKQDVEQDSFNFDAFYPLRVSLKNLGDVDYFYPQPTELKYSVNGSPATSFFSSNQALIRNGQNKIDVVDSIPITNTYFKKGGGNIVVVWPVGFAKVDSITDTIVVDWPLSNHFKNPVNEQLIYPNPAANHIFLNIDLLNFEHVRIYDLNGKLRLSQKSSREIDVSSLCKGVYVLKCSGKNKSIRSIFIKQ